MIGKTMGAMASAISVGAVIFLGGASASSAAADLGEAGLADLPIPKEAVQFVDGVRCGDPNDPHKVTDYADPSRIETVLGRPARVAADAWQVFGYTLTVKHPEKPHVVVVTYPDDAPRRVHFRVSVQKGYQALRAGLDTLYSATYGVNTKAWAKIWTPLFIPGGTGTQVTILFADSRNSRDLAPNHEGPKQLQPWAVGEVLLYEVADPAALLSPLRIAHPVAAEDERYFGFSTLGHAENYMRDAANTDFLKRYLQHIGVNFLRFAGSAGTQGGPPFGQPAFENSLALLDDLGVRTSFGFYKYFNAFLMDRIKTGTLPEELIAPMPRPIKEAIDSLDGWKKPTNLYEGGSYNARLMVMPLNWLDPEMGPWLKQMVRYYLAPAAKHKAICSVRFFGSGGEDRDSADRRAQLPKAVEAFTAAIRSVRDDLVTEVPTMYMDLRARERLKLPVPYAFDYAKPFTITTDKGETQIVDRVGFYDGLPEHVKGVIGGMAGSLWRGCHVPPPGLAILESPQAVANVRKFDDGWIAEFRIAEQNESESPKGIGWINDYYMWSGPAYRINVLKMMAANPRYVLLSTGHEGTAWQEGNLRVLAAAWRAFPWGPTDDLSVSLAPQGSRVTVLKAKGRWLLANHDPVQRTANLAAEQGPLVDAVTGQALADGRVVLQPFGVRTVMRQPAGAGR